MPNPASSIPISERVYAVEASYPSQDTKVRALLVRGDAFWLLVDTLGRPGDLAPVADEVARSGKPLLIVNSHADWDHWWGNAAFPGAPVLATRAAAKRQRREGKRELERMARKEPAVFGGFALRPATVAFEGVLRLDLGGVGVELHPLPGHTHDQVVAYL